MDRDSLPLLNYLIHRGRIPGRDQSHFPMEKPFIANLQNEVHHRCDIWYVITTLKFVVMHYWGNILGICREYKDRILEESN